MDGVAEHECPYCRAPIPLDDVEVQTRGALCRACGQRHALPDPRGEGQRSRVALETPPRWVREQAGPRGAHTVTYKRPSAMAFFLVPFTAIWAGGSLTGIYGTQLSNGRLDLMQSLFGLPFLLGSLLLCAVTAYMLFGRTEVSLGRGRGRVFMGVGGLGRTRSFAYNRLTRVGLCMSNVSVNDVPQEGIYVENGDERMIFGTLMPEDAKRYIVAFLHSQLPS